MTTRVFPFPELENSIMSTIHPTREKLKDTDRHDSFESMSPRKQLVGMLVLLAILLLAVVLKSL